MIQVIVASERPIYLSAELLCARSGYFNTALNGGFEEGSANTLEIPWEGNAKKCVLFLSWLGSMELWTLVQQHLNIPNTYKGLPETTKVIWTRQNIPFSVMEKLVDGVQKLLEKLEYVFAWFNEKTATSDGEKQEISSCEDFFRMREVVVKYLNAVFSPHPEGMYPEQYYHVSLSSLANFVQKYPIAVNCIESAWLFKQLQARRLQL